MYGFFSDVAAITWPEVEAWSPFPALGEGGRSGNTSRAAGAHSACLKERVGSQRGARQAWGVMSVGLRDPGGDLGTRGSREAAPCREG
jgi:hypothetical protein